MLRIKIVINKFQINSLTKAKIFLRIFGFFIIPLIGYVRPSIKKLNNEECIVNIKLNRKTKNHLRSMYLAVLTMGADLSCGLIGLYHIQKSKKRISLIYKDLKSEFLKRPNGDVDFICTNGCEIEKIVRETIDTGERKNILCTVNAICNGELVCKFELTLSLKYLIN
jgi:hypothetical protein